MPRFIVPRVDGLQRLVSGSYKQFKVDSAAVGLPLQWQYQSRSTFRNLVLQVRPDLKFPLDLITHPKPGRGSDAYTRLNMQWEKMCEAVTAIDPAAWRRTPAVTSDVVTFGVAVRGLDYEKPPTTLRIVGGKMEREKGFEPTEGHISKMATALTKSTKNTVHQRFPGSCRVDMSGREWT